MICSESYYKDIKNAIKVNNSIKNQLVIEFRGEFRKMNTYTFKIGFKVNDIISAVHCPLEGFLVSVDKTPEIKEVNERKQLNVYIEDYMCSSDKYALSAKYVCSVSDLLDMLKADDDEKDDERYIRVAKEFVQWVPYFGDDDLTSETLEVKQDE